MFLLAKTANKHKHTCTCSNFLLFSVIYQFELPTVLFGGQPGRTGVKLNPHPMHLSSLSMFTPRVLTSTHPLSDFTHIQKFSGTVQADTKNIPLQIHYC